MTDTFAQSCVEVIEHCLNTPPDEHRWELEEEWWFAELGERAALYVGVGADAEMAFFMAVTAWAYRYHPEHAEEVRCDGLCVWSDDIGIPGYGVAYPHPGCPLHAPGQVCECGMPDRCLSPTHGRLSMSEALVLRHRQALNHGGGGRL